MKKKKFDLLRDIVRKTNQITHDRYFRKQLGRIEKTEPIQEVMMTLAEKWEARGKSVDAARKAFNMFVN